MKIIPKSKLYKVKSSLYNIPVNEVYDNSQSIRRPGDSIDLFIVMLKRQAEYRIHVLFKPVGSVFVERFLKYLRWLARLT